MTDNQYLEMILPAVKRLREIADQSEELHVEAAKLRQWINATANMLPDDQRISVQRMLGLAELDEGLRRAGLYDAVRQVLERHPKEFLTVARVRDELLHTFDFSRYRSNPLASVSTALRRFKRTDVEVTEIAGVTAYRWKKSKANQKRKIERETFDALLKKLEEGGASTEEQVKPDASKE
jgi:hypothetical protein